ncbi:MAG: ABC transporter permease [Thiohalocapsa sp. PB-PSB1]|nr:MAG: ABC transporter permease [Thiohalocapsa sp. PB-PSB1]HCS90039.1 cell division protein [Chromatiaceae bacterium]
MKRHVSHNRVRLAIGCWLGNHQRAMSESVDRLLRVPLATAMTVAALGIALALPTTLFLVLDNLQRLGGDWQRGAGLSLFLDPKVERAGAEVLAATLRTRTDILRVDLIPPEQGLAEFREYSGLGAALDQLGRNPLPMVLAVYPAWQARAAGPLQNLAKSLEALPKVDFARLDAQWTLRFNAIVDLLTDATRLLAAVLGLAVLLVVGNSVRLEIENRRAEVEVMDLVGATAAFIRRPFLYSGAWYGLLGGIFAWIIVSWSTSLLQGSVNRLATLYHTEFILDGLGPVSSLVLIGASITLGVCGSWLAVGRHLSQVQPA